MPTYATANVCSLPLHQDTIEHTIRTAAKGIDVVMWQEMDADLYGARLLHALPGYAHFWGTRYEKTQADTLAKVIASTPQYASPISYNQKVFKKVDGGSFHFQKGQDGYSRVRLWTWLVLEEIATGRRIIAHAGHPWRQGGPDAAYRLAEWNRGRDVAVKQMTELQKKYGYLPMVIGIDANRTEPYVFLGRTFNGYKVTELRNGLDRLIFVDGKGHPWEVPANAVEIRPIKSDHDAVVMRGAWLHPAIKPTPKPTTADDLRKRVIRIARDEVGTHEGRDPDGNWNNDNPYAKALGMANGVAWCCEFTIWVFWKAGLEHLLELEERTAWVPTLAQAFKDAGRWGDVPKIGAVPFFGGNGTISDLKHVGAVVTAITPDTMTSVQGNTNNNGSAQGDGVYELTAKRRSDWVVGYGYPDYEGAAK